MLLLLSIFVHHLQQVLVKESIYTMIAKDLISSLLPPLKTTDSGEKALRWMADFHVRHLPIVEDGRIVGVVSEDDILDHDSLEGSFGFQQHAALHRPMVNETDHIYDVIKIMVAQNLSVIPVINDTERYLGVITLETLVQYFANALSMTELGAVIVLETTRRDYSLAEIARISESEQVIILSSYITSNPLNATIEVTLKVNKQDIGRLVATFERFDYSVKAFFQETDYYDSLKEHYDSLMSYLNI